MYYSEEDLNDIYDSTGGRCYYSNCRKRLSWKNYGIFGARGAWEVDHRRARSRGGSDSFINLVPACIECNRKKSDKPVFLARYY